MTQREHGPAQVPSAAPTPIERILRPFQEFVRVEASGGILLLSATVAALLWANSQWEHEYFEFFERKFTVGPEGFTLSKSLLHWINDGLMAIFFFVVGLEIKRELLVGELASVQQAALPLAGALGGMIAPAGLYALLNATGEGARGWGIPMATDIAFAMGAMALLGTRVPVGLKVFLTALAIADDIGAVVVIAFFYTGDISWISLGVAAIFLGGLVAANALGVRHPLLYGLFGFGLWVAMLKSGIHATIAGVLAAMTVPARPRIDAPAFLADSRSILAEFESAAGESPGILTSERQQAAVLALEKVSEHVQTPLQRFEHSLLPWMKLVIMPVFALANAGVVLGANALETLRHPVSLGVICGLVLGKPLGIFGASWLAVRFRLARLPAQVTWRQLLGAGILGGIGFTMSIFIAGLAFETGPLLDTAKTGILAASAVAGVTGFLLLFKRA